MISALARVPKSDEDGEADFPIEEPDGQIDLFE